MRSVIYDENGAFIEASDYAEALEVVTRDDLAIVGVDCITQAPGPFTYPFELQGFTFAQLEAQMPDGLALVEAPTAIEGTVAEGGEAIVLFARDGNHTRELTVSLEISELLPPVVSTPVPTLSAGVGEAAQTIDLNDHFDDPDTETIVRMETVLGNIDVSLTDSATPLTVQNFLTYADRGDWDGTFFHRSVESFVIQGGGFRVAEDGAKIERIKQDDPIQNEYAPSRSNVCGTIAMAKLGGDPNSATNQWFFNINDNSENLDNQNGGFTTFGRILGNGLQVAQAIADLPTGDFPVAVLTCEGEPPNETCTETAVELKDWPLVRLQDTGLDTDDLVYVNKISRTRALTFALISNSAPDTVTASVLEEGQMMIEFLAPGTAEITVSATDLDGRTTSHTTSVTVSDNYDAWAARNGLTGDDAAPAADPDKDGINNYLEYALGLDPNTASVSPVAVGSQSSNAAPVPSITFPIQSLRTDVLYAVEYSINLSDDWQEAWNSSEGIDAPAVLGSEIDGHTTLVTVGLNDMPLPVYLRLRTTAAPQ